MFNKILELMYGNVMMFFKVPEPLSEPEPESEPEPLKSKTLEPEPEPEPPKILAAPHP